MHTKRVLAVGAILTSAGLAASVALAGPAQSASGSFVIQNVHTGLCVDDSPKGLRAYGCNNLPYQKWTRISYTKYGGATWVFQNWHTKRCIDDSNDFNLRAFDCNYAIHPYQHWRPENIQSELYLRFTVRLKNINTLRCLDDSSQGLRSYTPCHTKNYQRFRFTPTN